MTFFIYLIATAIMAYAIPTLTLYDPQWFMDIGEWKPESRGLLAFYLVWTQLIAVLIATAYWAMSREDD